MSRLAERAEMGLARALQHAGVRVALRRRAAAAGAYDPATGVVAEAAAEVVEAPALVGVETVRLADGAVARRREVTLPARLVARYFGAQPWGQFPWSGELPLRPAIGDEIEEPGRAPQRVVDVTTIAVAGRPVGFRLALGDGA